MKTSATILFAICLLSQLALSAGPNDLEKTPQKMLEEAVNFESLHESRIERLLKIEKSQTSLNAFVAKKSKNTAWFSDAILCVRDELSKWKRALLSATESEEKRALFLSRRRVYHGESNYIFQGNTVNPYVLWNKYNLTETAACINDAHDKFVHECFSNDKVKQTCSVYYFACGFDMYAPGRVRGWIVGESDIFARR